MFQENSCWVINQICIVYDNKCIDDKEKKVAGEEIYLSCAWQSQELPSCDQSVYFFH